MGKNARHNGDWYKVIVNGYCWLDRYANIANATFGAIRGLEQNHFIPYSPGVLDIRAELLPPLPKKFTAAAYTRKLRAEHGAVNY